MSISQNQNRTRDERVNDLVARRQATGNELLIAQFGEIPRGLNQDAPLGETVTFHSVREDPNRRFLGGAFTLGYITPEAEKRIYINKIMTKPYGRIINLIATRMAIARVHDVGEGILEYATGIEGLWKYVGVPVLALTLFSSFRYALASSVAKAFWPSIANTVGEEFMHTLALKGEDRSWTVQNAFRANAEDMMKNAGSVWTDTKRVLDMVCTLMPLGYFQRDEEILGRLFNLAAHAYPAHGRLPQNREEMWMFLLDMGIKAPTEVQVYFDREQYEPLRDLFFKHRGFTGYLFPPSAEINIGINAYRNKAVLEMYWQDAFPALFAEMYRLLGDSGAPARFGFDVEDKDIMGIPNPVRPEAPLLPPPAIPEGALK